MDLILKLMPHLNAPDLSYIIDNVKNTVDITKCVGKMTSEDYIPGTDTHVGHPHDPVTILNAKLLHNQLELIFKVPVEAIGRDVCVKEVMHFNRDAHGNVSIDPNIHAHANILGHCGKSYGMDVSNMFVVDKCALNSDSIDIIGHESGVIGTETRTHIQFDTHAMSSNMSLEINSSGSEFNV